MLIKFFILMFSVFLFSLFVPKSALARIPLCDNLAAGQTKSSFISTNQVGPDNCPANAGCYTQIIQSGRSALGTYSCYEVLATTGASSGSGPGAGICDPLKDTNCIKTALGPIPTEPAMMVDYLLKFFIGIGGGIALLMMILGSFRMITSLGNPEQLKAGREQFQAAIIGLMFIIFSVLLLEIIGVDILNLPGFGK